MKLLALQFVRQSLPAPRAATAIHHLYRLLPTASGRSELQSKPACVLNPWGRGADKSGYGGFSTVGGPSWGKRDEKADAAGQEVLTCRLVRAGSFIRRIGSTAAGPGAGWPNLAWTPGAVAAATSGSATTNRSRDAGRAKRAATRVAAVGRSSGVGRSRQRNPWPAESATDSAGWRWFAWDSDRVARARADRDATTPDHDPAAAAPFVSTASVPGHPDTPPAEEPGYAGNRAGAGSVRPPGR